MGRVSDARERLMTAVTELIWQGSYGRTTIDQICDEAGVKKGSFYYFFDSKSELAAAALEDRWQEQKQQLDAIFSPTVPPLERIRNFCQAAYQKQLQAKKECGCVLGCPLFCLGAEVCHQEAVLHAKIKQILGHYHQYLESAIREADREGMIKAANPAARARMAFAYIEGLLTQARIVNDAEILREMPDGVLEFLGAREVLSV